MPASPRPNTVVIFLVAILAIWLWALYSGGSVAEGPNGVRMGVDIGISFGAAQVSLQGGNPYDRDAVLRAERALLRRDGYPAREIPPFRGFYRLSRRVGNPPLYFWALRPLLHLGFRTGAKLFIAAEYVAFALAFFVMLAGFGWRRRLLPCLLFLAMPEPVFATVYGNANVVAFVGIACALALMRKHPIPAGGVLSLAWVKPQVALPVAALIVLFNAPRPRRMAAGFGAATVGFFCLTLLTTGWHSVLQWAHELVGYSGDLAAQTDMPTLSVWYSPASSVPMRLAFEALFLGLACALTGWWWWRNRSGMPLPLARSGWLWAVWMLATPFDHWHDELLLAPVVVAMLGTDARYLIPRLLSLFSRRTGRSSPKSPFVAVLLLYFTVFALFPTRLSLLPFMLIGVTICTVLAARDSRYGFHRSG